GDGLFADAVSAALGPRPHRRVPSDAALEDVAAVLSSAALFVGSSLHGAITALVHDRPFVLVNLGDESKLRGFVESIGLEDRLVEDAAAISAAADQVFAAPAPPGMVGHLQQEVDRHFDALGAAVVEAMERRVPDERPPAPAAELALRGRWLAARRRP
ncbi:MAG TPA: polysaccharide pyruvyl transferase family protein, partial [Acidimicrobiales bacterium]|nr:polysaccharide pyruvyl transferase family protein [Acidimicrobiales bacterium]